MCGSLFCRWNRKRRAGTAAGPNTRHEYPGAGIYLGRDYTVFATLEGRVKFEHEKRSKKRVSIVPGVSRLQSKTVALSLNGISAPDD